MMKAAASSRILFPRQLVLVLLASAIAIPALAQQEQSAAGSQSTPPAVTAQSSSPEASNQPPAPVISSKLTAAPREGFWGRVNPFARKKWVNDRVEPIKGQINELDEVNAKNARDIQDVDSRAQAGIHRAQSSADAANQMAMNAGNQAQSASATARGASTHVDQLNSTVNGLDQYRQTSQLNVTLHNGNLPPAARKQLDELATSLAGRQGYVLEIEGYSPLSGSNGIQSSRRLTDAVKRYLVVEDAIPVYRMHSVALGNAPVAGSNADESKPVKASCVRIRLMENTLAAQEVSSPHDAASITGAADRSSRP